MVAASRHGVVFGTVPCVTRSECAVISRQEMTSSERVSAPALATIRVIGLGRAGSAIAARLGQRGVLADGSDAATVLLCVPDAAIHDAAATIRPGPWVAHVSGATRLCALDPHTR